MPKYKLSEIERLKDQAEIQGLRFEDKWNFIGNYYQTTRHAVRKWYYREKARLRNQSEIEVSELNISSDQWRTAYLILYGKVSRDTVENIKKEIALLCEI